MSRTFQDVCDRARKPLNDPSKRRYPDADLLAGANDAILILRSRRPDLFFGQYASLATTEYALGTALPVPDEFFVPVWQYVVAWAEFRDDEAAMQERAKDFYALFTGGI